MKTNIFLIIVIVLLCYYIYETKDIIQVRVYDCGMAEWHPDIPDEVKTACRKRFLENHQNKNFNSII